MTATRAGHRIGACAATVARPVDTVLGHRHTSLAQRKSDEGPNADLLIQRTRDFGETYAEVTAWDVPASDRYPEGVKYSMQYGTTDGETIIRYDNFPDHPDAAHHHKHRPDGEVEDIDFPGLEALFVRFKQEVRTHGEPW